MYFQCVKFCSILLSSLGAFAGYVKWAEQEERITRRLQLQATVKDSDKCDLDLDVEGHFLMTRF